MPLMVQELTLPIGYQDAQGRVHRQVLMRLATARDEIEPLGDARVRDNEAYLGLLLLSRVVLRLGDISPVPPELIGELYAADFSFLQEWYGVLNSPAAGPSSAALAGGLSPAAPTLPPVVQTRCPNCQAELTLDLVASAS